MELGQLATETGGSIEGLIPCTPLQTEGSKATSGILCNPSVQARVGFTGRRDLWPKGTEQVANLHAYKFRGHEGHVLKAAFCH